MRRSAYPVFTSLVIALSIAVSMSFMPLSEFVNADEPRTFRYLPIGDSYTIGADVMTHERWPNQLSAKIPQLTLLENPARSGWTVEDALRDELPVAKRVRPDFVTLLIGTNDWASGVSVDEYRASLVQLIEGLHAALAKGGKLMIVTIPDFSTTLAAKRFADGRDISAGLALFNKAMKEEAAKRQIEVADIFELSKNLNSESGMLASDGLHPSGEQYRRWVEVIAAVAMRALAIGAN